VYTGQVYARITAGLATQLAASSTASIIGVADYEGALRTVLTVLMV